MDQSLIQFHSTQWRSVTYNPTNGIAFNLFLNYGEEIISIGPPRDNYSGDNSLAVDVLTGYRNLPIVDNKILTLESLTQTLTSRIQTLELTASNAELQRKKTIDTFIQGIGDLDAKQKSLSAGVDVINILENRKHEF